MGADIRAPKENACNTGYNLRQVTWLLTGYLDRFMSCLLAETLLPLVVDQLERHQKELHYPSHLLNVGNSLRQEALGTVPNFPTALRGSFHYRDTTIELGILSSFLRGRRSKAREVARKFDNAMSARPSLQTSADFSKVSKM